MLSLIHACKGLAESEQGQSSELSPPPQKVRQLASRDLEAGGWGIPEQKMSNLLLHPCLPHSEPFWPLSACYILLLIGRNCERRCPDAERGWQRFWHPIMGGATLFARAGDTSLSASQVQEKPEKKRCREGTACAMK